MPKKFSDIQKKELINSFMNGNTIKELSEKFNCTTITITRHLKKSVNEKDFKNQIKKNNQKKEFEENKDKTFQPDSISKNKKLEKSFIEDTPFLEDLAFVEIAPFNSEAVNNIQKDFASVPISEVNLPSIVYMVVDKNIELETKFLKEYADWQFLSQQELNRNTIEIYSDIKLAKRYCKKEQKVIKVPNTNVFKIVAPLLVSRGISRIVSSDKLIAL